MASIKIHRDIFNYERKRKGFTSRQITGMVTGIASCVAATAFLTIVIEIPFFVAIDIGILLAVPCVTAGFVPLYGMPAEEAAARFWAGSTRGSHLLLETESSNQEEGVTTSRVHRKAAKTKGYECSNSIEANQPAAV